ncbi:MAG: hypothetical protein ACOZAM_28775 [Pseudomonadota bacterium]
MNAVVIPFPKRAAHEALYHASVAHGPAKVIIFPGVRYDRIPEAETEDLFAIATAPLKKPSNRK